MKKKPQQERLYLINDQGGYASGYGPMVEVLALLPAWRIVTKEEHDAMKEICDREDGQS
jgi:hypothetical protein